MAAPYIFYFLGLLMPPRPFKCCSNPACPNRTQNRGRCDECEKQRHRDYQKTRTDGNEFYRSKPWRVLRAEQLREFPLCAMCQELGRVVAATVADHVHPRRERPDLALEKSNLRSLCVSHHNSTTAKSRRQR